MFYNNRVYVAVGRDPLHGLKTKGGLFCIDATQTGDITTGGKIWSYEDIGRTLSTISIANGLLYVADESGQVYCMDRSTRQTLLGSPDRTTFGVPRLWPTARSMWARGGTSACWPLARRKGF